MAPLDASNKGDRVAGLVDDILECYNELVQFKRLQPCPKVNAAFERLMGLCSQCPAEDVVEQVLANPNIVQKSFDLRQLCSEGEYQLEAQWAENISGCGTSMEANELLQSFPYYSNYVDLVRMELNALSSVLSQFPPNDIAIVILGSGPLPLTSLCILRQLTNKRVNTTCLNVDIDGPAITLSRTMCHTLGVDPPTMRFQCADATSKEVNLGECDVVYLAALVGESSRQKQEILANVVRKARPGTLVVLRSAHSLRRLLYPVVEVTEGMATLGLKVLLVVHPYNHVINSVFIAIVVAPALPHDLPIFKHTLEAKPPNIGFPSLVDERYPQMSSNGPNLCDFFYKLP